MHCRCLAMDAWSVGMNLFNNIKYGEYLGVDANFESFYVTMLTLFR